MKPYNVAVILPKRLYDNVSDLVRSCEPSLQLDTVPPENDFGDVVFLRGRARHQDIVYALLHYPRLRNIAGT